MGNEINRRFKSMDRKMTTWVLGLMGLVVKRGFDFFSGKDHAGKSLGVTQHDFRW